MSGQDGPERGRRRRHLLEKLQALLYAALDLNSSRKTRLPGETGRAGFL